MYETYMCKNYLLSIQIKMNHQACCCVQNTRTVDLQSIRFFFVKTQQSYLSREKRIDCEENNKIIIIINKYKQS